MMPDGRKLTFSEYYCDEQYPNGRLHMTESDKPNAGLEHTASRLSIERFWARWETLGGEGTTEVQTRNEWQAVGQPDSAGGRRLAIKVGDVEYFARCGVEGCHGWLLRRVLAEQP